MLDFLTKMGFPEHAAEAADTGDGENRLTSTTSPSEPIQVLIDAREPAWVQALSFEGAPTGLALLAAGDVLALTRDGDIGPGRAQDRRRPAVLDQGRPAAGAGGGDAPDHPVGLRGRHREPVPRPLRPGRLPGVRRPQRAGRPAGDGVEVGGRAGRADVRAGRRRGRGLGRRRRRLRARRALAVPARPRPDRRRPAPVRRPGRADQPALRAAGRRPGARPGAAARLRQRRLGALRPDRDGRRQAQERGRRSAAKPASTSGACWG